MGIINILADVSMCDQNSVRRIFSLLGNLFSIIQIAVPIIIIIMGTIDLVKAMTANDPSTTKKAQTTFIKRLIIAVCIFFVLPLIKFLMSLLGENMENPCMTCFTNPNDPTKCYFTTDDSEATNSTTNNNGNNNTVSDFDTNNDEIEDLTNVGSR